MTDETDQGPPRRRTGIAVAAATLALGLGALGAAATGAFAGGGDSGDAPTTGATTFAQDAATTPGAQQGTAPDRDDCPGGGQEGGGAQGGEGAQGSSTTPS